MRVFVHTLCIKLTIIGVYNHIMHAKYMYCFGRVVLEQTPVPELYPRGLLDHKT